jgi:hypothetical protein
LQCRQQGAGVAKEPQEGFKPGVFKPEESLSQFEIGNTVYLNMDPAAALYPGPLIRPWHKPKVLANAARISRGPWRFSAAYDASGLVASQAFFGVWPTDASVSAGAIEAILNSPLTNAFIAEHASNQHITNQFLKRLPMPKRGNLEDIQKAVDRYREALSAVRQMVLRPAEVDPWLNGLLVEVDAEVLKAYDLPPRLERRLLEFFRGHERERRVGHAFNGWIPMDFTAFIPLHEYLGPLVERNRGSWALEVFTPAPEEEAILLEQYVH